VLNNSTRIFNEKKPASGRKPVTGKAEWERIKERLIPG